MEAGRGQVRLGVARSGLARLGKETNGLWWRIPRMLDRSGGARLGLARQGQVRRGAAGHVEGTNGAFHF